MNTLQFWQTMAALVAAYAALFGGIYAVVTAPLLRTLQAEIRASEAQLKLQLGELKTELKTELGELKAELKTELGELKIEWRTELGEVKAGVREMKAELGAMEARLSQHIADKLSDHGERITRLEERRFR